MRRRTFLKTSFAATLAAPLSRLAAAADPTVDGYLKTIGLQLYTLRNQMAEDMPGTLKAVADAGYAQVEMMDAVTGREIAQTARGLGLDVTSAFINFKTITAPGEDGSPSEDDTLRAAEEIGLKHLVFGYIDHESRKTADQYRAHCERANAFGKRCRDAGVKLCYHNHSFEFEPLPVGSGGDGPTGFEILRDDLDAELCPFELDVFWAALGGLDPVETLRSLKGRLSQVHLKDLKPGVETIYDNSAVPKDAFQELGDGRLDIAACLKAAAEAGAEQCHVEQDQSPDPLASVKESLAYLRK